MSNHTDFVDLDLARRTVGKDGVIDPIAARRAAASNLDRMSKQRERLEDQVATAAQELERLRQRQEDIARQKKTLEEIRALQQSFLTEKQKLSLKLQQSLALLEKEDIRVTRLTELYQDSRRNFEVLVEELTGLDEQEWREEYFDEDLQQAYDQLKALSADFGKGLARLDALGWTPGAETEAEVAEPETERGFLGWMKIGVAIAIPLAFFLLLAALSLVSLLQHLSP